MEPGNGLPRATSTPYSSMGLMKKDRKIRKSRKKVFIPCTCSGTSSRGKFLAESGRPVQGRRARPPTIRQEAGRALRVAGRSATNFIKKTGARSSRDFQRVGNAIEYLGRYTHKIAISNSRLLFPSRRTMCPSLLGLKAWEPKRVIVLNMGSSYGGSLCTSALRISKDPLLWLPE